MIRTEGGRPGDGGDADPRFTTLLEFVRDRRGFDVGGYRRSSLLRCVGRRMAQVGIEDVGDYLEHLRRQPAEFGALVDTLLVNVTGFLRDQDAWLDLRTTVLPRVVAGRPDDEPIRVWCAGCSTGEEPYSVAMLLADLLGPAELRERVRIYATDVDERALRRARRASYTDSQVEPVPPELRNRYLEARDDRWVVHPDLRAAVVFGRGDLMRDPPISRVDLLVCRNTLMYFNAETQSGILENFHLAMRDSGALFLGTAEMLLGHRGHFTPLDAQHRFFRKRQPARFGFGGHQRTAWRCETGWAGPTDDASDPGPEGQLVLTVEELATTTEALRSANAELTGTNDELRAANDQLDEANALLGAVLTGLRTAVIVVDRDLTVRVWNRRAEDLWRLRGDAVIGRRLPDDELGLADRVRALARRATAEGDEAPDTVTAPAGQLDFDVVCGPVRDGADRPTGAFVLIDEAARRRMPRRARLDDQRPGES